MCTPRRNRLRTLYISVYLSKVVKVVFVVNPSIVGSQTVGLVRDVLHVEAHTVVELPFEELGGGTHTHTNTQSGM